ncbi:MAG: adenylate kinase [Chloroflexi bacterium]|nr:adenylate kinase [Chloroflexota bacterium]
MVIVLLGAPGAGKGTQAEILSQRLGLPHVASGDLFREALRDETPLGLRARSYMERGELVPDEVTIAMVAERLEKPDCANGVILDGFPRTIPQADALDAVLARHGQAVNLVPYIKVSVESLLKRLGGRWTCRTCGTVYHMLFDPPRVAGVCDVCGGELYQRADDTPETQRKRIDVYFEQTQPLIEYYRQRGLLVEIDGEKDIDGVQAELLAAIESRRRELGQAGL